MTNLKEVKGENKYCGPSALSAICNITTDEAERICQQIVGTNKPIKGLWPQDLRKAFNSLGYHCMSVNFPRGVSLFNTMFKLSGNIGMYVFEIPGHFITIEVTESDRYICDNHTRMPINIVNSARLNQKVLSAFKVVKNV